MTPTAANLKKRTGDGMLRALPPHLTRPPKRKRHTDLPRSRPSSPLSLPPMSRSPDPEKNEDLDLGTATAQAVIETEATSLEEITSPDGPLPPSALDQKVSALEDKIGAMQTKISTFEKETVVLKERLVSLGDQLVALEKVIRTSAPSLQSMIVDEAHKIILASQTVLLAYINTYILGPIQKLKF